MKSFVHNLSRWKAYSFFGIIFMQLFFQVLSQVNPPSTAPLLPKAVNASNLLNDTSTTVPSISTRISFSSTSTPKYGPRQSIDNSDSLGISWLCESDNDEIGEHLGCDCDMIHGHFKSANCANRWIGFNSTDALNFPPRLNISRRVRFLDLSFNYIEVVDENTFGDCAGLQELTFYKNHIKSINGLSCHRLKKLNLSWNLLTNLTDKAFKNLSFLEELDLSFNNMIIIEPNALDKLQNLRVLNLASNPIGLELAMFSDYILSLDNLNRLEELDLSNTSLLDFPLSLINGTKNIKTLKLALNKITFLPNGVLHELSKLEVLDLSGTAFGMITPFTFNGLGSLSTLRLDRMPYLTRIEQHAFAGLTSLRDLSCQKNHNLNYIDVLAFRMAQELEKDSVQGDSNPKYVSFADCSLTQIGYGLLVWKDLEFLELDRNPWICDCSLQWVAKFHRKRPDEAAILTDENFACKYPHIFAGVPVARVNAEEMLCYSPIATIAGTVGILLFAFLLFTFCSIIILNYMGMLPEWVRHFNIFGSGSSLPNYKRVYPKPPRKREDATEPSPGDLEWDTGDIGST